MAGTAHYAERASRVLDICGRLEGDLSLKRLSEVGCFSPCHVHRIFQGITRETVNGYVRRARLGRAPNSWDRRSPLEISKICKAPEGLPLYSWRAGPGASRRFG